MDNRRSSYLYNLGISFYNIAAEHPSRPALKYIDGTIINYSQLNLISNQVARTLLEKGITKGKVVAIFNEKSYLAYATMLACLKIGAIYTNLDISSPWPRIKKIIETCEPSLVVFDKEDKDLIGEFKLLEKFPLLYLFEQEFADTVEKQDRANLEESFQVHGGNPAYLMFTSGSTGFPKGAVMSHSNVLNFIQWGKQTFSVTVDDIFTNANPIYFDNSVFDFYTSLYNGATLVPLSHDLVKNAGNLVQAINNSNCTIWFSVPSLLVYLLTTKALSRNDFASIRRISFGGEGFPKNKLKQLYDLFGERITLFNVYGPTECTCICSSYIISDTDFENMNELAPLGFIAPNFGYEILPIEEDNKELGELALTGPCVGLGYYNDPERTTKSFVQHPYNKFPQLMYKTGDLVQRTPNGHLHFKGRVDNQIKHMGYRIELEEIEAAFSTLSYINESGVIYERLSAELGQIKAFVSVSDSSKNVKDILADIKNLIPPYMVPRVVIILPSLPKNSNGKIDRKQLAQLKS